MTNLIYLVLGFLILNGLLWGAQEIWYWGDNSNINNIEKNLEIESNSIDTMEKQMNEFVLNLEALKASGNINLYNQNVKKWNQMIIEYETKVTNYNKKINELNSLYEKTSSRWYLIPIPIGRGGSKFK